MGAAEGNSASTHSRKSSASTISSSKTVCRWTLRVDGAPAQCRSGFDAGASSVAHVAVGDLAQANSVLLHEFLTEGTVARPAHLGDALARAQPRRGVAMAISMVKGTASTISGMRSTRPWQVSQPTPLAM